MMTIYQGVDLVEIVKFREIAFRHERFLADIFTEPERAYCDAKKDPPIHYAGRFAAKEAVMKALGSGFSGTGIDHLFQEIQVLPSPSGRPEITVSGWAAKIAAQKRIRQWSVSISHTQAYALSTVILVGEGTLL